MIVFRRRKQAFSFLPLHRLRWRESFFGRCLSGAGHPCRLHL
jgi:hypothetical protein